MVPSASLPVSSETVSLRLAQIAHELSQDPHQLRIKKLLRYACTQTWETDRQQLDRMSLSTLLQNLFEICPSFEQLQLLLHQAIATLNKSAEYTIVANTVISRFHPLYAELQQRQTAPVSPAVYERVAHRLAQAAEPIRIKKLLLLTCRSTWETDEAQLAQVEVIELVQELHQIAPTLENLQTTLKQVATTLSKPADYAALANSITTLFQPLYPQPLYPQTQYPEETAPLIRLEQSAVLTQGPVLAQAPVLAQVQLDETPALRLLPMAAFGPQPDLFNLRLEIMQDTNPFKVKILLFSLLHEPFQGQAEQDGLLKTHDLDELLRLLFLSYRFYAEVTNQLRAMAKQLAAAEYAQTAEIVLRAIQPFYTEEQPPIAPPTGSLEVTATDITRMKATPQDITVPDRH